MSIQIELHGKYGDGKFAIVDDDIPESLLKRKWIIGNGYVMSWNKQRRAHDRLHRLVTNCPEDMVVDHKNHNRLDNRKSNLRICTVKENNQNIKRKGYYYDARRKYWVVRFGTKSRIYHSEEEALKARQLIRSGNVPQRTRKEAKRYLPSNVVHNRLSSYGVYLQRNNKRYLKYGFKTIAEAVSYRDNLLSAIGEVS